jgi:D-alanyl-D-alanine carboxypeptidase (penicillin-binding protein 5/6)
LYPASTTKILTALVTLENEDLDDVVAVGDEIALLRPDASKAGLQVGQEVTVRELLYALMLPSGNDAAYTLAVEVARETSGESMNSKEALSFFAAMMNQRAMELGAKNSHFENPDGYHSPEHYSTAYDMALIARAAMQNNFFRQVVQTPAYQGHSVSDSQGREIMWANTNRLLNENDPFYYSGATGIKTGHTTQAGYCLVASASRRDTNLIAVVLNSTATGVWAESARLLDYGFSQAQTAPAAEPISTQPPADGNRTFRYFLIGVGFLFLYRMLFRRSGPQPRGRKRV